MACSKIHIIFPNYFLVLLLAVPIYFPSSHFARPPTTYEITILDNVPGDLLMHIKCEGGFFNGEDSLIEGESYIFFFKFSGLALFCNIEIGKRKGHFSIFNYFDEELCPGDKCLWSVRTDGIYQFYDNKYNLIYHWP
ncbi:hypothetical protein ACP275_07G067900 [Erythranthe tilingii]